MPRHLAPGVFVEEPPPRGKAIEGVDTSTAGFVGPTRTGPVDLAPEAITSLGEYERAYGGGGPLDFSDAGRLPDYLWHAARAFFHEGGERLHVARVYRRKDGAAYQGAEAAPVPDGDGAYPDGHARATLAAPAGPTLRVRARHPGAAGNVGVRLTLRASPNLLSFGRPSGPDAGAVTDRDVVLLSRHPGTSPGPRPRASAAGGPFYLARREADGWRFEGGGGAVLRLADLRPADGDDLRAITVDVAVIPDVGQGQGLAWPALALDPDHLRDGVPSALLARFPFDPSEPSRGRALPIVVEGGGPAGGLAVLRAMLDAGGAGRSPTLEEALHDDGSPDEARSVEVRLRGGHDGQRPRADDYRGTAGAASGCGTGLDQLRGVAEVSLVAAPGATHGYDSDAYGAEARAVVGHLVAHCEAARHRFALLDSGDGQGVGQVRAMRAALDSKHAALFYPWVMVLDPASRQVIPVPPSGFVAGLYARSDRERGVHHAPAAEDVRHALGLEASLDHPQQEVLALEGVNAFRAFGGRGVQLWGARTVSADPAWRYVNVRRHLDYLERSIEEGTGWAVFEPNGPALWTELRRSIEQFLLQAWRAGALAGARPEEAYFVRCDRTTMTEDDLAHGRLVCLVGVATLRPAEFMVFRIGRWTDDAAFGP